METPYQKLKEYIEDSYPIKDIQKLDDEGKIKSLSQKELLELLKSATYNIYSIDVLKILTKYSSEYTNNAYLFYLILKNSLVLFDYIQNNTNTDISFDNNKILRYAVSNPYRKNWIHRLVKDHRVNLTYKKDDILKKKVDIVLNYLEKEKSIKKRWVVYGQNNYSGIKEILYGIYNNKERAIDRVFRVLRDILDFKYINEDELLEKLKQDNRVTDYYDLITNKDYYWYLQKINKMPPDIYIKETSIEPDKIFKEQPKQDKYPIYKFIPLIDVKNYQKGDFYMTTKSLGKGAFGEVYEGFSKTQQKIAVKKIEPQKEEDKKKIIAEASVQKYVNNSYTVNVYSPLYKLGENYYILMEYMDSVLSFRLSRTKRQVIELCKLLVMGLINIHNKNIAHLDIKPENILTKDGIPKYGDFGFACILKNCSGEPFHADRSYKPPETFAFLDDFEPGKQITRIIKSYRTSSSLEESKRANIYSLGQLMLTLVLGDLLKENNIKYGIDSFCMIPSVTSILKNFEQDTIIYDSYVKHMEPYETENGDRLKSYGWSRINPEGLMKVIDGMTKINPTKRIDLNNAYYMLVDLLSNI